MPDDKRTVKPPKHSPFKNYEISRQELCYQSAADLSFIVDAWRKIDTKKNPHLKSAKDMVLSEWKKRKELHGKHKDISIFDAHSDFLQLISSIKYSSDALNNPHAHLALVVPGTMEIVWCTPAMRKTDMLQQNLTHGMKNFRHSAGLLILLHRLYAGKLDLSKLPMPLPKGLTEVFTYQPTPKSQTRYYRIRLDNEIYSSKSWSVKMELDGELPPLDQEGLNKIINNPYDPDYIGTILDTRRLMFNGLMFVWFEEITYTHQIKQFQERLTRTGALRRRQDLKELEKQLQAVLRVDIEVGIILNPFENRSRQALWRPHLKSLRFEKEVNPSSLDADDPYILAYRDPIIINSFQQTDKLDDMKSKGYKSLIVATMMHHNELIGLIEFGSPKEHAFDYSIVSQCIHVGTHVATAVKHIFDGEHERIMAVIKQTCTAIHPSVEWRFQQMARNYIKQMENNGVHHPEPVVFKQVVPLFGVSDIRGSSRIRNESIQADLEHQLHLAADVIYTAEKTHSRPVFDELGYRIRKHQRSIAKGLKSGDEVRIYSFLRNVVESAFDELSYLTDEVREKVIAYRNELDAEVGVVYQIRKKYDNSVTQINDTIGAYIDNQQELAQEMIPHYFEKFKTDGVDHNIYVGDSLLETGTCSPLDLRNLYLWQLMCMCGVVWLMRDLKQKLSTPLDTAHLILLQSTPLNITFQMEEKHFSVDGAYNARYEIVKKRIDKAKILETGERLTQPEQIAIVYTQEKELVMYKELISYLQELGYLKEKYIDVLLEDLQGVHGLRALRVQVADTPPAKWSSKKGHPRLSVEE